MLLFWGMKNILTALLFMLFAAPGMAQVSGSIADTANRPVPFATVVLLKAADSTQVKAMLGNENGDFRMDNVLPGNYRLRITAIGYQTLLTPAFAVKASAPSHLGKLVLKETAKTLAEVQIRSIKPQITQQPGGLAVNVQNSIMAKGSTVLEVLQRSPGVVVSGDHTSISLNGNASVMIMIDGKLERLSMTQVLNLLNGMSADNVDKIELLNTPPASYDAEGTGGLINIITKKNKTAGTNGSFTATAGYGYREKASAAADLYHNTGKLSLHGFYSYSHDRRYADLLATGTENVGAVGGQTAFNYTGTGKTTANSQTVIFGIDDQLNAKTTAGFNVNYSAGVTRNLSYNYGAYILKPDSVLLFNSHIDGDLHYHELDGSLYIEHTFATNEKLRVDANYIAYKTIAPSLAQNSFVTNNGKPAGGSDSLYAPMQKDYSNSLIQVGVLKADYNKQLGKKWKLESGIKGTFTQTSANSGIDNLVNGQYVPISNGTSSNLVTYEWIGAAYSTLTVQIDTLTSLTFGARYEYSRNSTDQPKSSPYYVDRRLGELFPSVFLSRKIDDSQEWQLSYTNRINRPSYSDLGSYVVYNDPVSVFAGNPTLQPAIIHNFKIGYNDHDYLFSLLFSHTDNPIFGYQLTTGPTKGIVYIEPHNANWQNTLNLQAVIPVKVSSWWDMNYTLTGGPGAYRFSYTPSPVTIKYLAWQFNFTESFKMPAHFSAEVSGYYNSPSYYGNSRTFSNTIVNLGIKKVLPGNGGSFQFTAADLFHGANYGSAIGILTKDVFDTNGRTHYQDESYRSPIFKLTYYRPFGSAHKSSKTDNGSTDEEKKRL